MSDITKPVILDETGQSANQKIKLITAITEDNKDVLSQRLMELGSAIDTQTATEAQKITELGPKIDAQTTAETQAIAELGPKIDALAARIPSIIEAMDRLDIIYYVERE